MTVDANQGGNAQTSSPSRVIAFYRDGVESESARAANAAIGATVVRPLSVGDAAMLALPRNSDLDDALEQLRSQPGVVEASPDSGLTLLKR